MSPEQVEDSRLIRGMVFGFIFSIPAYLILGVLGFTTYHLWRLVFG